MTHWRVEGKIGGTSLNGKKCETSFVVSPILKVKVKYRKSTSKRFVTQWKWKLYRLFIYRFIRAHARFSAPGRVALSKIIFISFTILPVMLSFDHPNHDCNKDETKKTIIKCQNLKSIIFFTQFYEPWKVQSDWTSWKIIWGKMR